MNADFSSLELPGGKFSTIVVDPPWPYLDALPGKKRGAATHYKTMAKDEILNMEVESLAAENAHLYICVTNAFIGLGLEAMWWWGFEYKTMLTWVKVVNDRSRIRIGMGHYFRNSTGHVLFGVRGSLPPGVRNLPTAFNAPRGEHSQKPQELYDMITAMSPEPRVELFARNPHAGFIPWGDGIRGD